MKAQASTHPCMGPSSSPATRPSRAHPSPAGCVAVGGHPCHPVSQPLPLSQRAQGQSFHHGGCSHVTGSLCPRSCCYPNTKSWVLRGDKGVCGFTRGLETL